MVFHFLLPSVHPDARGGDSYTTSRWGDTSHNPQAFPELAWDLSLPSSLSLHRALLSPGLLTVSDHESTPRPLSSLPPLSRMFFVQVLLGSEVFPNFYTTAL